MLHRLFRPICFLVAAWAATGSAWAQAPDIFTVRNVPVDARADDGLTAKTQGLARGQKLALRMLMERMTLQADHDRLPDVDNNGVAQLLRDYSIADEKIGGGRYLATLTARFKPDDVRATLRRANIPFAETRSLRVLVLPVFQSAGTSSLWDDPNPWLRAWTGLGRRDGLLPLVVPVGDLSDVAVIGAEQAVQGQADRLVEIGRKYDSRNTLVSIAALRINPGDGALQLETSSTMYRDGQPDLTAVRRFDAPADKERDGFLAEVARTLAEEAEESWKRDNLIEGGGENRITVAVPISGMDDWLDIRRRLRDIASMKKVDIARLSTTEAEIVLSYVGNPAQLRLALAQQDLDLRYDATEAGWMLQSRRGQ
jgi:hypothetical protein